MVRGALLCLSLLLLLPVPAVHGQTSQPQTVQADVRALLSPRLKTTLSSQLSGQLIEIAVRFGQRFEAGDILFRLDCRLFEEQLRRAEIDLQGARQMLNLQRKLDRLGSGNQRDRVQAEIAADRAASEMERRRLTVTFCDVAAPFSGRVTERKANPYQHIAGGQPILDILDDSVFEVNMIVPSFWLAWLQTGTPFVLRIDETGRSYDGTVTEIGAQIDPASQSLKITGRLTGQPEGLVAGMSGTARFSVPIAYARGVPQQRSAPPPSADAMDADTVARPAWTIEDGIARPRWEIE